jgi:hypothetical protein
MIHYFSVVFLFHLGKGEFYFLPGSAGGDRLNLMGGIVASCF